jgi:hypothetical protein
VASSSFLLLAKKTHSLPASPRTTSGAAKAKRPTSSYMSTTGNSPPMTTTSSKIQSRDWATPRTGGWDPLPDLNLSHACMQHRRMALLNAATFCSLIQSVVDLRRHHDDEVH